MNETRARLLRISLLDWRLQIASLAPAMAMAIIAFSADTANSYPNLPTVSSWSFVVSVMQYLLISGIILAIISIMWPGSMGRVPALTLIVLSISVGFVMVLAYLDLGLYQLVYGIDCPDLSTLSKCPVAIAENPTISLVFIGLLIPTLIIVSIAVWLIWAARKHPEVFRGHPSTQLT